MKEEDVAKDENENENEDAAAVEESTTTITPSRKRKKRLSKRERKTLKNIKKKKKSGQNDSNITMNNGNHDTKGGTQNGYNDENNKKKDRPKIDGDDISTDDTWIMESYRAIPIPERPSDEILNSVAGKSKQQQKNRNDDIDEGGGSSNSNSKTLGKWFPNAILIKCPINYSNTGQLLLNDSTIRPESVKVDNPRSSLVLFYQYTPTKWSPTQLQLLMTYLRTIAETRRHLGGRIRIAQEGVNATVSSIDSPHRTAKETIRFLAQDLRNFDPIAFQNTDFKYIDDLPPDRHFKELKLFPVQELVYYDIPTDDAPVNSDLTTTGSPTKIDDNKKVIKGGVHLNAKEYHEMLKKENTVVIDVRNHYETIIGRFDGQQQQHAMAQKTATTATVSATITTEKNGAGAEYLDPLMRRSTDFKSWVAKDDTKEKLQNKSVLMYCTGGIRCERASAYLKKEMGNNVQEVYQLQGGIERYLQAFPDGGFWRGKNFVFDKREAIGVNNLEGDGGVIRKNQIKKKKKARKEEQKKHTTTRELPSKCVVCDVVWDRYVGKKKCYTCGVPVLMCDKCMSLKPDKTPGMKLKVRCPLCVKENKITQYLMMKSKYLSPAS